LLTSAPVMLADPQPDPKRAEREAVLVAPADRALTSLALVSQTFGVKLLRGTSLSAIFEQPSQVQPSIVFVHMALEEEIPWAVLRGQLGALIGDLPVVLITSSNQTAHEIVSDGPFYTMDEAATPERLRQLLAKLLADSAAPPARRASDPERVHFIEVYASLFRRGLKTRKLEQIVARIAAGDGPVSIIGEAGTGKKCVARAIHYLSRRSAQPCLVVNCSTLAPGALEAEMWRLEVPATGSGPGPGRGSFEPAPAGTLVLENVGELPEKLQATVLGLLDTGTIRRPGSGHAVSVDLRLVATSIRDIPALVSDGRLQRALGERLRAATIALPPLRERGEDIGGLAEFFRRRLARQYLRNTPPLSAATIAALTGYSWPGNVLELENLVRRYVVLSDEQQLVRELSDRSRLTTARRRTRRPPAPEQSLRDIGRRAAHQAEMTAILATLQQVRWNRAEAARRLRVSYKTLLNKLTRAGVVGPAETHGKD
jgi:two-component system, NtrC family, response regulator AtoC